MPQADKKPTGRETTAVPIGDLTVVLNEPLPGQIAALRRIVHLLESEDKAARGQGGELFLDVADTLVSDPAILNRLYQGMATERIKLEEYADGLVTAIKTFLPPDEEEGTEAIKGTRRPASRARVAPGRKR